MSETISDLYFRLGLDSSDLQDDFIDADRTISANIRRLNREQNLVQIRAQVELNGLDDAANSTEGLKIQQEALARQIEIQQSKISLVNAAYREMADTQGDNAEVTQQLLLQLERERLALSKLEQQTRSLNEQQEIALGMNFELLGLIEPAMKGIDNAIAAGRNIPIPHAKAVAAAAIGLLSIVAGTIEATDELRENNPANVLAEGFDDAQGSIAADLSAINADVAEATAAIERQTQTSGENVRHYAQEVTASYEDYLQDFLRLEQILTAETETLNDALRIVDGQLPYMKTELGKYGAMAFGVAKSFDALKNSAIEFARPAIEGFRELSKTASTLNLPISKTSDLVNTARLSGGDFDEIRDWVRGVQDAVIKGEIDDPEVLALEKYNVVIQDSMGNLLDFETTHNRLIEGAIRAAEAGELESYAIMTQGEGIHSILPYLKSYVQAKQDANKIRWSTTDEATLKEASRNMKLATVQAEEFAAALSALGVPLANMALESNYEFFKTLTDLIEDNRETILLWEFTFIEAFKRAENFASDSAKSIIDKIKSINDTLGVTDKLEGLASFVLPDGGDEGGIFAAAKKRLDEFKKANEDAARESGNPTAEFNAGLSYSIKRIREYKNEIRELERQLKWGEGSYQKRLADIGAWRAEASKNARFYAEELAIIDQKAYAMIRQVEADRAKALQEIRESVRAGESSELENQYAGVAAEARSWINDGMSEVEALQLAEKKKQQIRETYVQKAQELIQDAADREYSLTHDAFEKQLYDVERWKQAQLEKAETAEEVAATIADAAAKEAEAFEREMDRIQGRVESGQDRLARLTLSQRDYDLYKAFKDYQNDLKDLPRALADAIYHAQLGKIDEHASNDESGSYTKGTGFDASSLINADPRKIAAMEALKNYGVGTEELKKALGNTATAQETYRNILQRVTAGMSADSEKLGSAFTGVANGVSSLGDAAGESADKITTAADTIKLALEMVAGIEEENARREAARNTDDGGAEIIYGDQDYGGAVEGGYEIIYGDLEGFSSSLSDLSKSTADMIRDYVAEMDSTPIENFQQEVQQATGTVADIAGATENLANAAESAGTSTNAFSEKLNQTADTLDALREKIANTPLQILPEVAESSSCHHFWRQCNHFWLQQQQPTQETPQYDNFSDVFDKALKATATVGELTALGGLATLQPEIALLGAGMEALANTAQTLRELAKEQPPPQPSSAPPVDLTPLQEVSPALEEISTSIQGMSADLSTKLAEIAQGMSALAQSVSYSQNRQPPQVNVTVNPNINLGGAYVFDNALKQQLTNDITTEVANAVTSAVKTATAQADYGYGN